MNLFPALADPALTSMNLLNEIAERHPAAISFAAGRPTEEHFCYDDLTRYLDAYRTYLLQDKGYTDAQVNRELMQYGRTQGVINDLVARNLLVDEGITASPESIVVTVGCQEAMFLVLRALRATPSDVVLAVAPTYVGVVGAARLLDMPVLPVRSGPSGVDLDDLVTQLRSARAAGLRPRALYLIPEFANPSGVSLDLETRHRLLSLAASEDFLLLEDNPYGLFQRGFTTRPPTLKALDSSSRVIYLGSFAKTAVPGARVGYVVADQPVGTGLLSFELAKLKSMLTVNTSPIAQAVVGGKLLEHGCSLVSANVREAAIYRRNMTLLLNGLATRFPSATWTVPSGGFFVVLSVDFHVDDALLAHSASRHGVLWTPMHHFYGGAGGHNQLRLSCSSVTPAQIPEGLDRLAALVSDVRRAA
ncbi:aminotransferase-like domain-containing protein [Lentzea flava]|uniref:Aminotransferase n=1 Tax=Lentzea flava TaxID=103732 RepID=A0ABQ2UGC2_9PSEU|nr:PLP-dependent aminotransferase family protein [Lentzea flava]MCP2198975.1 (S)-3,5-dihydroxyphenylglycine transaminase [Lentzea flava]GGU32543.1 aminotransferase [Lentzea flava]